ncbi:unnamed protein product [Rotaria sp. Silwood1]|nr:unnamed protein product [Rotaria sp. Silwood1]CAF3319850.1 unnamed protein product [Rotaria sp. Silwood1]CAF3339935.1 unnamed protein product [Rotaria sp. Silwood1]CAF4653129.1 unnamed protein product [Rotaria sp. Silwood1]CAF4901740.1 unnamed protein product [Rotaria sp. Silwood1]
MEDLCVRLTDMPDEILLLILNKLTNIEVLYSLIGINIRLDKIVNDPIFTEHLTLMRRSSNGVINLLDDSILKRFYSEILPKIHYKIKWFDLEPLCMERILLAADYPNLHGLSLFNIERETILRLFDGSTSDIINIVCTYVLIMCTNLLCLKFHPYSDIYVDFRERLSFESIEPARFFSSNLMELQINVDDFTDCLYLLDGRFPRLCIFYVDVRLFTPPSPAIINKIDY